MPKTPKGGKGPTDVIGNAVHVIWIATGEIKDDAPVADGEGQGGPGAREEGWRGSGGKAHAGGAGGYRAEGSDDAVEALTGHL